MVQQTSRSASGQTSPRRLRLTQLDILADKRARQVNDYLHVASRRIVDWLVAQRIGTLVIGKNDGWKQAIGLGKRINQNFVFVPHARFIEMLCYKAELMGIQIIVSEESYTSKCSFLDLEIVGKHETYAGKRVKRGMFLRQHWTLPQRRHQWRVQHFTKSSPERLWQRDSGCCGVPGQDCPENGVGRNVYVV